MFSALPGKSGEIIKNYLDMRFCILKSFTEKPENECKEILKELPLIENSGTVNIIKKDKFILREYPAADGYMFVIENSEIFEKEETTAFAVSPKFEPKIMETLTIPKAR